MQNDVTRAAQTQTNNKPSKYIPDITVKSSRTCCQRSTWDESMPVMFPKCVLIYKQEYIYMSNHNHIHLFIQEDWPKTRRM